jgi:nitrite reductase/ring-hydroxylating ferredoxin subunit
MPSWERAVPLADLSGRDPARAVFGDLAVCLVLADGAPFAVRDACAHRETALSGGIVRDGILTCPGHFWRYDLRTGQCLNRPDHVPSYPCRVTGGWVEVLVPDPAPAMSMRQMLLAAARQRDAGRDS